MQSSTDKIALHLVQHGAPAELCPAINDRAWPGDLLASHGRSACHAANTGRRAAGRVTVQYRRDSTCPQQPAADAPVVHAV